jgi:hypothetical protein
MKLFLAGSSVVAVLCRPCRLCTSGRLFGKFEQVRGRTVRFTGSRRLRWCDPWGLSFSYSNKGATVSKRFAVFHLPSARRGVRQTLDTRYVFSTSPIHHYCNIVEDTLLRFCITCLIRQSTPLQYNLREVVLSL